MRYRIDEKEYGVLATYFEDLSQEMKSPRTRHLNPRTGGPYVKQVGPPEGQPDSTNHMYLLGSAYAKGRGFPVAPYEGATPAHLHQIHLRELVIQAWYSRS